MSWRGAVGVEGADAELILIGQVVDGDGFAGAGVEAGVESDGVAGILVRQDAEGVEEWADVTGAVAVDEVDAQAGAGLAELDGRGGVEDDGIGGRPRVYYGPNEPVLGRGRVYASPTCGWRLSSTAWQRRLSPPPSSSVGIGGSACCVTSSDSVGDGRLYER